MIIEEHHPPTIETMETSCQKTNKCARPAFVRVKHRELELQDYQLGETIGEGGFGFVRKATHLATGQTVAVKICPLSRYDGEQLKALQLQIDIQRYILHQNIAQVYQVIKTGSKIYIFMQYCKNGQLFNRINRKGPLTQKQAAKVFHQILSALLYLRQNNLSHRDIKPQNILFDHNWNVKIIDFGFSCIAEEGKMRRTFCGTPSYMPPQIIKRSLYDSQLADVWSLGVTLYAMLAARLPFDGEPLQNRKQNIIKFKYTFQPSCFSHRAQKLLSSIFVDAKYRPKLQDLLRSQFALYFEAPHSRSVDFKIQDIELQTQVMNALSDYGFDVETLAQSVKDCKLNKYRTLYFLTLKKHQKLSGNENLSSFRKHKKLSAAKLAPMSIRTPSIPNKSSSIRVEQLLTMKTTVLMKQQKIKQKSAINSPLIIPISLNKSRLRRNENDSPRRLIDCLSAYKHS